MMGLWPKSTRTRGLLLGAALFLLGIVGVGIALWWGLPAVTDLKDRRLSRSIVVRDWQGRERPFVLGPANHNWVPLDTIPAELKWSVIVAEDGNFYEHQGVDVGALKEALRYDLEKKRLARGASTITQQLAKNLYLSREKSLLRKGRELLIARRLEAELSKGRILELYLNLVELGPLVHGVGAGARYHFGTSVAQLTPAQCATLAAILPGPRIAYNPKLKPERVKRRAAHILQLLQLQAVLSPDQEAAARGELFGTATPPPPSSEDEAVPTRDDEDAVPPAAVAAPVAFPASPAPAAPLAEPAAPVLVPPALVPPAPPASPASPAADLAAPAPVVPPASPPPQ